VLTTPAQRLAEQQTKLTEKAVGKVPEEYLRDFSTVFEKTEFDRLPEKRRWDHAIELKDQTSAEGIKSKVYPLARSEQEELD
jgi:hypothetical protein